jgi:hypothetical protein
VSRSSATASSVSPVAAKSNETICAGEAAALLWNVQVSFKWRVASHPPKTTIPSRAESYTIE